MINFTRKVLPLFVILGLNQNILASPANDLATFKQSWLANALKLQREIDLTVPLNRATFLATHNSYNSKAYQIPVVRYIDPNQTLSLYDQLEAGARSIELDGHWTFDNYFGKDILLCHGKSNHLGCSVFDRKMTEGLQEIRRWVKKNPNEVVLLYLERFLDGHEPRMASMLELNLGEFIYKPSTVRDKKAPAQSCVTMPTNISKADILKTGKQVLVVTKGCDGNNPNYKERNTFPQIFSDWVFMGINNPGDKYNFLEEMPDGFSGYPDCGKHDEFAVDPTHISMWRIHEDRTVYGNIPFPTKKLDEYVMQEMVACGVNWQTMDMLSVDDKRLYSAVWSWAPNYPKEGAGECAVYRPDSGIINVACGAVVSAVACKNEKSAEIAVVKSDGQFASGAAACTTKGEDWRFIVPINGREMDQLLDAALDASAKQLWVNYTMDKSGKWVPNMGK